MTTVLAAIDTSACAGPVLDTATHVAALFDATARALHVREDDSDAPNRLARAAGSSCARRQVSPCQPSSRLRAPGRRRARPRRPRRAGGPATGRSTALDVITRVAKPVVVVPPHARPPARVQTHPRATRRHPRELPGARARRSSSRRADIEIIALHVHSPASVPAFSDQPHHEAPGMGARVHLPLRPCGARGGEAHPAPRRRGR